MKSNRCGEIPLGAGVFLASFSVLLFEIALTRIFSVLYWYHFAFLAISISLFGVALGGLLAHLRPREASSCPLTRVAALQQIATLLAIVFAMNLPLTIGFSPTGLIGLTAIFLLASVPFTAFGWTLAIALSRNPASSHRIYALDLGGGALACAVAVPLLDTSGAPHTVVGASVAAGIAALVFGFDKRDSSRSSRFLIVLAAIGTAVVLLLPVLEVRNTKLYRERDDLLFEKWTALARIAVYPGVFWQEDPTKPFGWGFADGYEPRHAVDQLWIEQDASAGTPITRFDGDFANHEYLGHDVTSLAFQVMKPRRAFIIGAGGGRDVLTALAFGSASVVACDVHPAIIDLVRTTFADFAGHLYDDPRVEVAIGDGRSVLCKDKSAYSVVQLSLIDTWAATAKGSLSLSENSLYTKEAFEEYLSHLEDDGVLSVTRYLFQPRQQSLRVALLARSALEAIGVEQPDQHVIVCGTTGIQPFATVLVKKTPFDTVEILRARDVCEKRGFHVLYAPGTPIDPDFGRALLEDDPCEAFADYPFDVSTPTDDRPFFFHMLPFVRIADMIFNPRSVEGQRFNYAAQAVLVACLVVTFVFVFILCALPFVGRRSRTRCHRQGTWVALTLGLGFMMIEIPLVQKGTLWLGHPTYGLSVVLASLLLGTGLGSFASGSKNHQQSLTRKLTKTVGIIAVVLTVMELTGPHMTGLSTSVRILFVAAMSIAIGVALGSPFPSTLAILARTSPSCIPWVWTVNAAASVLGSVVATSLAMGLGYRITWLSAIAIYGLSALVARRFERHTSAGTAGMGTEQGRPRSRVHEVVGVR